MVKPATLTRLGYTKFEFAGIENIHVMRESLNKFMDLFVQPTSAGWLSGVESTKYLVSGFFRFTARNIYRAF